MFADINEDDLIEEQANVIKTGRLVKHVLKLGYIWTIYEQQFYDSAFLKDFADYKDDIHLDHSNPIQKLLNKNEMMMV